MPIKAVSYREGDAPIWDELIGEHGDPRPYEPAVAKFTESFQPDDEPLVDPDYVDDLLYEIARDAEDALAAVDGWIEAANEQFDLIYPWPQVVLEERNMLEVTTQLTAVGDL